MSILYELEQERKERPLNGPGKYRFFDGYIWTRAIEIPAVEHCNLNCKWCSHSSLHMPPFEADPNEIHENLCLLSKFLRVENVRIVGGEPLLHKNIRELLSAVKTSGICERIHLITNGTLLHTLNMHDLKAIDKVEISLYPINENKIKHIINCAQKISKLGKRVVLHKYTHFREAIAKYPTKDINIVNMVYSTCQIAHFYRCITISNGHLFRCPQSTINSLRKHFISVDALKIYDIYDIFELLYFFESPAPLESCKCCFGSIGRLRPHQQNTSNQDTYLSEYADNAIDFDCYKLLSRDLHANTGCYTRIYL